MMENFRHGKMYISGIWISPDVLHRACSKSMFSFDRECFTTRLEKMYQDDPYGYWEYLEMNMDIDLEIVPAEYVTPILRKRYAAKRGVAA